MKASSPSVRAGDTLSFKSLTPADAVVEVGSPTLTGTQLSLSGIGATQMACPPPAMDEEAVYLAALERVTGYAVDGRVLSLTLVGGGRLRYRELLD